MKTTSINICTLCVPCDCRCRYCLLSWDGKLYGADYDRCRQYGENFYNWLRENRPELSFAFYWGYSMEHPRLLDAIDFLQKIGSPSGEFLQFNGMKMRSNPELSILLSDLKTHGIKLIDLTFYGTQAYHDRFAGRKGDFDLMIRTLQVANELDFPVKIGIPVTQENVSQIDDLLHLLDVYKLHHLALFIPHEEGRGIGLRNVRLREEDYCHMSERAKGLLNRNLYRTEADWLLKMPFAAPRNRVLTISLTPENIETFEKLTFDNTVKLLEQMDENYHAALPDINDLAKRYGDPTGSALYRLRDLQMSYQKRYIEENNLQLYDIHDERQCFVRRF